MAIIAFQPDPRPAHRLFQHPNPAAALGLAVSHLMTKPAFARLPFGSWSRILVGQINRKHYYLALDRAGHVSGFLGWALADEAAAEAWLAGSAEPAGTVTGDCLVINAWSAEAPAVNHLLLDVARAAGAGHRLIYFKRHYPDGSTRMGKLTVSAVIRGQRPALRHIPRLIK